MRIFKALRKFITMDNTTLWISLTNIISIIFIICLSILSIIATIRIAQMIIITMIGA